MTLEEKREKAIKELQSTTNVDQKKMEQFKDDSMNKLIYSGRINPSVVDYDLLEIQLYAIYLNNTSIGRP